MAAGGTERAETYLRLLAEAELRRAPVLPGPGSQPHRVALAATALASADAISLVTAWQVVADFQAACALRVGDPGPALLSLRSPGWQARPPASLTPSGRPSPLPHSVAQFLVSSHRPGWVAPTAPPPGRPHRPRCLSGPRCSCPRSGKAGTANFSCSRWPAPAPRRPSR